MTRSTQTARILYLLPAVLVLAVALAPEPLAREVAPAPPPPGQDPGNGALIVMDDEGTPAGSCPLEHTAVRAEISGFLARVEVTQQFRNLSSDKIEAVYTFPLRHDAAVDDMEMRVGDRTVRGEIRRREEARRIYEQARRAGHVASLLDQERPNIFTQHVANIEPGAKVEITIRYVEQLPYEAGSFTFAFPTVVGPRFIPGAPTGRQGTGWAPDTDRVPDASLITPPVTPKGTRAGHDISIEVVLDAGVPIRHLESKLHEVAVEHDDTGRGALVRLVQNREIPNRDFVLTWQVAGEEIRSGYLAHRTGADGYLTLMLLPPKRARADQIAPREMIFVVDRSGSQSGKPIGKAKETLLHILDRMRPQDTFQLIDFSNGPNVLFPHPMPASPGMLRQARAYISTLEGNGGTRMDSAVRAACSQPADGNRLRIVTMMTDGYIGNDLEVLGMVQELRGNSRWFPFGTGNSVNRFLLDNMAKLGGGEAEYVYLNASGEETAKRFYERIDAPVLTDVRIDFGDLPVTDVYPAMVSDVWEERPLYIRARYTGPARGSVTLRGFAGGLPYEKRLQVVLPAREESHAVLGPLWARARVDDLMAQDLQGAQRGGIREDLKEEIVQVALEHRIMTQYTSFVAVEDRIVTEGGEPRRVTVPVEMPEGVSYEGVFGQAAGEALAAPAAAMHMSRGKGIEYMRKRPLPATGPATGRLEERETPALDQACIRPEEPIILHADLRRLIQDPGNVPAGVEVRNGRVTVEVRLDRDSADLIRDLEGAGLRIVFRTSLEKKVTGTIEIGNLEALARVKGVLAVMPGSLN